MKTSSSNFLSPLRYPGGKASLAGFFESVLEKNNIVNGTYCEVYAGGAGAALKLLFDNKVDRIILNDADFHIYAFWKSILDYQYKFADAILSCNLTIEEWQEQRYIYDHPNSYSRFQVGFATFYLNRCNRGGILPNAGPIGGYEQTGNYLIDARFNKDNLAKRILDIAEKKSQIDIHNLDAIDFLEQLKIQTDPTQTLIYLDPPYYVQGQNLYLNFYKHKDHVSIEEHLREFADYNWIVSYDNVQPINDIYSGYPKFPFDLNYSVQVSRKGKELMVFSPNLKLPQYFTIRSSVQNLVAV